MLISVSFFSLVSVMLERAEFTELFDNYSKDYIIVTFLSILELVKEQEIDLEQEHNFAPIYIELIES